MKRDKARKNKPTYCGRQGHGHGTMRSKIRYRSLKDAKGARSGLAIRTGKEVRIYGCPECDGYHLTTSPEHGSGNTRTVWRLPDRAVSSEKKPDGTEEEQDGRG